VKNWQRCAAWLNWRQKLPVSKWRNPKHNQTKFQHVEKLPSFLLRQLKRWVQQAVPFWALLLARWVHWLALALDLRVLRN
jgi:hypothetical protein